MVRLVALLRCFVASVLIRYLTGTADEAFPEVGRSGGADDGKLRLWPISPAPGVSVGVDEWVTIVVGLARPPTADALPRPEAVCAKVAGALVGCTPAVFVGGGSGDVGIVFNPAQVGLKAGMDARVELDVVLRSDEELAHGPPLLSLSYHIYCEPTYRRWARLPLFSVPVFVGSRQVFIDYYDSPSEGYEEDLARRSCLTLGDLKVAGHAMAAGAAADEHGAVGEVLPDGAIASSTSTSV